MKWIHRVLNDIERTLDKQVKKTEYACKLTFSVDSLDYDESFCGFCTLLVIVTTRNLNFKL